VIETTLRAKLPLVAVRTSDPVHAPHVVGYLAGRDRSPAPLFDGRNVDQDVVYCCLGNPPAPRSPAKASRRDADPAELHERFAGAGSTLVMVNPNGAGEYAFDAGELPTPPGAVAAWLGRLGMRRTQIDAALPALGGLTLREVDWVVRIATADGSWSPADLARARRRVVRPRGGLVQVPAEPPPGYSAPNALKTLLVDWRPLLLRKDVDRRLVPRGLLLDGEPGTGKTTAAKAVARDLGVPLYRFDAAAVRNKFVGESEKALQAALSAADRAAPCVLLIDEIEKLFSERDDEGATAGILAELLWWLSEHETRVLAVATTNDRTVIPPELIRPGRFDEVATLERLTEPQARDLALGLARTYPDVEVSREAILRRLIQAGSAVLPGLTPAEVEAVVVAEVRKAILARDPGVAK